MFEDYKIVSFTLSKNYTYFKLLKIEQYYFMKKVRIPLPRLISSFQNEISKYELVNRFNILPKMLTSNVKECYIIYEYLKSLSKKEIEMLSYLKKINIILEIINKVKILHDNNIIHCDLKLSNIIVTKKLQVYLLDLDHAKFKGELSDYGTLKYCSLDQLKGSKATFQFDIYALGIIIFELLLNKKAYKNLKKMELIAAKKENSLLLDKDLNKNNLLKTIISKATNSDLNRRYLSITELEKDVKTLIINSSN